MYIYIQLVNICSILTIGHVTHSHMFYDSFVRVPWLVHTCAMTCSHVTLLVDVFCILTTGDTTHGYVCHNLCICVPWPFHLCAMTSSYVCHDVFMCVPWRFHMCAMTCAHVCHGLFICVPELIHGCAMTHFYVCHDLCIFIMTYSYVTLPVDIRCILTYSYVRHEWFKRATWPIQVCTMTCSYVAITCSYVPWLMHAYVCHYWYACHVSFVRAPWLIHTCVMTHPYMPWLISMRLCPPASPAFLLRWHDFFLCVPWLINMSPRLLHTCHHSFLCDTACWHPMHSDYRWHDFIVWGGYY